MFSSICRITSRNTRSSFPVGSSNPSLSVASRELRGNLRCIPWIRKCPPPVCPEKLGILCSFHVDPVFLFHETDRILIDLRLGLRPSGITVIPVRQIFLPQGLRDLAATRIMDADKCNLFLFPPTERTAFSDALVVLSGVGTDNLRRLHLNPEMLLYECDCRKDGQVGIPLTATRPAYFADGTQRLRGHAMG